ATVVALFCCTSDSVSTATAGWRYNHSADNASGNRNPSLDLAATFVSALPLIRGTLCLQNFPGCFNKKK
ncbi:MAG: hypothetical protein QF607_07095, partial [Nitrospinaceae bacterium]|nr:hypothetical protein [Nitrospinaceae bacterium]